MNPPHSPMVVRKRLFLFFLIFLASILLMKGLSSPSTAQSPEERELEDKAPKHLPIRVKIKNEKAFKDLKNEKWLRDLEIEVTNTGDKPIYYLSFTIELPEVISPNNRVIGFPLRYGRRELMEVDKLATPEDVPIRPGETYVFKVPENMVKGWEGFYSKPDKPNPKKVKLVFHILSFGNGTGFVMTDGLSFPRKPASKTHYDENKNSRSNTIAMNMGLKLPDKLSLQYSCFSSPAIPCR